MFDTVIIGAGLSGLAAGIRLAYYEKPVCILERHTTIGGLNSFYRLRGRNYDVGLHAVTNYAEPGTKKGPLSKLLRQLRMSWDDFRLRPQLGSSIAFPDVKLRFNNDFELFRSEVALAFPDQIQGFERLLTRIATFNELDLGQQALSAREVVGDYLNDPLLIDMIFCPLMFYGSAKPRDMDFNQFVIMFKSIFFEGFGRPFEGVRLILKHLVRRFRSLGGQLWLRSGVREILIDHGRAIGVILEDGREVTCGNVLSSAGAAETSRLCSTEQWVTKRPTPGDISFCETIYALNQQPSTSGHNDTIVFYSNTRQFHYERPSDPCDVRSGIICSPNNFSYHDGQLLDDGILRVTALAQSDYWMNLPPDTYAAEKLRWEQEIYQSASRHMPDIRNQILDIDMFTPRTIHRFTGHENGCVYGAPEKLLPGSTPIKNLFLCGTDQGFLGIIGSMLSGITMANNHVLKAPS